MGSTLVAIPALGTELTIPGDFTTHNDLALALSAVIEREAAKNPHRRDAVYFPAFVDGRTNTFHVLVTPMTIDEIEAWARGPGLALSYMPRTEVGSMTVMRRNARELARRLGGGTHYGWFHSNETHKGISYFPHYHVWERANLDDLPRNFHAWHIWSCTTSVEQTVNA